MAKMFTYNCPSCAGEFSYMQHPSDQPAAPRFCPLCGFDTEAEMVQGIEEIAIPFKPFKRAITAPHVAKSIGKAADSTYRMMEETANDRIAQAAEMTGLPESDFNDMKITDLKDNLREGDAAAVEPPKSEVSKLMESTPGVFGFQQPAAAAGFAAAAHTGAHAYAGRRAQLMVNQRFAQHGKEDFQNVKYNGRG